jgi:hypothetical protein
MSLLRAPDYGEQATGAQLPRLQLGWHALPTWIECGAAT